VQENEIRLIKVATGSPQANGQVEIINRSLGSMIAILVDSEKNLHWDIVLDSVEHVLNNTLQRTNNQYPSKMLFGVKQRGKATDLLVDELEELNNKVEVRDIEKIREKAKDSQERVQKYSKIMVDAKRQEPHTYKDGDLVMIKDFDTHVGICKKLIPKFKGPYKIPKTLRNDRYVIKDADGFQQSRIPYKGVWAVANIKPWLGNNKRKNQNN